MFWFSLYPCVGIQYSTRIISVNTPGTITSEVTELIRILDYNPLPSQDIFKNGRKRVVDMVELNYQDST